MSARAATPRRPWSHRSFARALDRWTSQIPPMTIVDRDDEQFLGAMKAFAICGAFAETTYHSTRSYTKVIYLLYFLDFDHMEKHRHTVTGANWVRKGDNDRPGMVPQWIVGDRVITISRTYIERLIAELCFHERLAIQQARKRRNRRRR